MRAVSALIVIASISMVIPIQARAEEPRREIHLNTHEIMRTIESFPERHPMAPERFLNRLVDYLEHEKLGVGPVLTLLPAEASELRAQDEIEPPRFAFVARAGGRTLVSLTKLGSTADQEDRVLHQRWLISDLLKGQRYSVTVYNEHSLDKGALRFLGVGTRLMLRPKIEVAGWRFGFEMYGSYHPEYQATAYFALTGKTIASAVHPLPGAADRAIQRHGPLIPLRW